MANHTVESIFQYGNNKQDAVERIKEARNNTGNVSTIPTDLLDEYRSALNLRGHTDSEITIQRNTVARKLNHLFVGATKQTRKINFDDPNLDVDNLSDEEFEKYSEHVESNVSKTKRTNYDGSDYIPDLDPTNGDKGAGYSAPARSSYR
ncbi:hypothetical protein [Vibrio splendidus]|uniref:hypothetical protein n=1 Tax=Vibrio splendidus TaxID=29497 RepID=UPI000D397B2C|nr:hypothetical protein [Vibrio splendidus]PTP95470.1 hypothetical protein CWO02_01105 [Vibrio splendidus]